MFGRRAAAAADNIRTKIFRKMLNLRGETFRRFVVMLFAVLNFGQTCIRQDADRQRRILAQITKTVGHMLRPGAAVHTDHVDRKWF